MAKFLGVFFALVVLHNVAAAEGRYVSVFAYNVENLWDAVDDPDQGDPAFLPLAAKEGGRRCAGVLPQYRKQCLTLDWTDEKYRRKLVTIASVVMSFDEGRGADVLVFEELENYRVLYDLFASYLSQYGGYQEIVHFESEGNRGIDVGIISRLPVVRTGQHIVDYTGNGKGDTRDIVEAELDVDGHPLIVAANHWPSQGSSTEKRAVAARVLLESVVRPAQARGVPVIATGDFNTLDEDNPNPIYGYIADANLNGGLPLGDVQLMSPTRQPFPGTYYYSSDRKWNRFDRFLATKDLILGINGMQLDLASFQIFAPEALLMVDQKTRQWIPRRYNFDTTEGYSDHLPVAVRVYVEEAQRSD